MSLPKKMEKQWGNADLSETKQIIYQLKGIDESYPKFESLCQMLWAFLSNFGIFYNAHSPNMVISRDPRSKFRKFFNFVLILHLILGKSAKFLVESSPIQKLSAKNLMGVETPPPPPVPLGLRSCLSTKTMIGCDHS